MNQKYNGNTLLSREETAAYVGVRPQTLAVWASNKRYNLPFIKIGRCVRYRLSDIEVFISRNTFGGEVS